MHVLHVNVEIPLPRESCTTPCLQAQIFLAFIVIRRAVLKLKVTFQRPL